VLITGGTNDNEVMNGVYFRMSSTFGIPVYRNVRVLANRFSTVVAERFLFKRDRDKCWIISDHVDTDVSKKPGHAFVDEDTESPGQVTQPWYVWHAQTKSLRYWGEDEAEEEERQSEGKDRKDQGFFFGPRAPTDHIKCSCIAGFEVQGRGIGGVSSGLLLRDTSELYGRPVYQAESGGQFLYFMTRDGNTEHGLDKIGIGMTAADLVTNPKYDGHWIISTEFGTNTGSPSCLAYVEDRAVTPYAIKKQWFVVALDKKTSDLKLVLQESCAGPDALVTFDRLEEENITLDIDTEGTPVLPLQDRHGHNNPVE